MSAASWGSSLEAEISDHGGLWWASSIMSWSDCQVWGFLALDSSQKSPVNQGLMEHEGLDLPFFEWNSTPGKLSCGDKIWLSFRFPTCEASWNKISCKDRLVYNMLAICQDQIFMKICPYKSALLLVIIDHASNFEKKISWGTYTRKYHCVMVKLQIVWSDGLHPNSTGFYQYHWSAVIYSALSWDNDAHFRSMEMK